jgi:hypothetical protein
VRRENLALGVAVLILLVWGAGAVFAFYGEPRYADLLSTITPLALAAAGYLFATPLLNRRNGKDTNHGDD